MKSTEFIELVKKIERVLDEKEGSVFLKACYHQNGYMESLEINVDFSEKESE